MTEMIRDRRYFHMNPELDNDTVNTAEYIKNRLDGLDCRVFSPIPNSVCAFFDFGREETAAFRSDMDALPVTEKTGLEFASKVNGRMHACGHDGHMAMLLEFARRLGGLAGNAKRNALLIFQPAEETTGGAKRICETGIFEKYNVMRVFGYHIVPDVEKGVIASRPGELMAKSCEVTLDIHGVPAHIGKAAEGRDALYAAAMFVCGSYEDVSREMADVRFKLLKFGRLTSGSARNTISGISHLEGSIRCYSQRDFERIRDIVKLRAEKTDAALGVKTELGFSEGYLPVCNDRALYKRVCAALGNVSELPEPRMIAEDFSYYQEKAPGVFLFLGSGSGKPLHSDEYDFDECILETGVKGYEKLILME